MRLPAFKLAKFTNLKKAIIAELLDWKLNSVTFYTRKYIFISKELHVWLFKATCYKIKKSFYLGADQS